MTYSNTTISVPIFKQSTTASVVGVTSSTVTTVKDISGDYIFDVTKDGYLFNKELGELKIISKEEYIKAESEFDFSAENIVVSNEYIEENSEAEEEIFDYFVVMTEEQQALNQVEEDVSLDLNSVTTTTGSTDNLKPTKSGYLQGGAFTKTITSGGTWTNKVDKSYKLTGFKFGKPKITEESFISRVKKQEGGIANGTSDNAYRTHKDNTVVPISKRDNKDASKYNKLCTNSSGDRIYNIHTNKGILWIVFKNAFGIKKASEHGSISLQERFLKMSDDDWWKVMKERFVTPNKGEQIKSKITSYFWVYNCWHSGAGGAIRNLNNSLNMLKKSNTFTSDSITNAHITYMNDLYDQGKEDQLISAMYDVRVQFLLNISQPGDTNHKYRNGWVNSVNNWITDFHQT
jgi:hypothetical protein